MSRSNTTPLKPHTAPTTPAKTPLTKQDNHQTPTKDSGITCRFPQVPKQPLTTTTPASVSILPKPYPHRPPTSNLQDIHPQSVETTHWDTQDTKQGSAQPNACSYWSEPEQVQPIRTKKTKRCNPIGQTLKTHNQSEGRKPGATILLVQQNAPGTTQAQPSTI